MCRQGWHVTSVDPSAADGEPARGQSSLSSVSGRLSKEELLPASFDVITMRHSLEKTHEPLHLLCQAHRLLVPGGRLLVVAANIDSLPFRWFGSSWCGLDLPRRLVHFSPWTLQLMLQRAEFHVGPIRMLPHERWLRRSAQNARMKPGHCAWHGWLSRRPISWLATWYTFLLHQSDCMIATAKR